MFLIYYGYYELWEVFIPTTFSMVIMLSLVGLKVYYEEFSPRCEAAAVVGEDTGSRSETRSKRDRVARAELIGGAKDASSTNDAQPLMSS